MWKVVEEQQLVRRFNETVGRNDDTSDHRFGAVSFHLLSLGGQDETVVLLN
jgi:hypothetical protein